MPREEVTTASYRVFCATRNRIDVGSPAPKMKKLPTFHEKHRCADFKWSVEKWSSMKIRLSQARQKCHQEVFARMSLRTATLMKCVNRISVAGFELTSQVLSCSFYCGITQITHSQRNQYLVYFYSWLY